MKKESVSYSFEGLPPLTEAQVANLKELAARPEEEIDLTDLPPLSLEQLAHARRSLPLTREIYPFPA